MSVQISMIETNNEYKQFVEKFKPKKTTDDCYTPPNIYEAIKTWVCEKYGVDPDKVVRPFFPGGDYERFDYSGKKVVIDNPPFSIVSQIVRFYEENGVDFFLFAPYLTNFGSGLNCCHIITSSVITYENGARIDTAFLTSLDKRLVVGDPELGAIIKEQDEKNRQETTKQLPKYDYPDNVLTSAMVGRMAKHGVPYELDHEDALFIRSLDSQRTQGKVIFGGGYLLSEKATQEKIMAEKIMAEKIMAEKIMAEKWQLSEREQDLIKRLGGTR